MWAIRVLSGPQAGQVFPLKEGKTRVGRGQGVDLQLNASGISKEHLEITVVGEKLLFTDLNSSNGTFLNGTRVKSGALKLGDKVGIHTVIVDVVVMNQKARSSTQKNPALMAPKGAKNLPSFPNQYASPVNSQLPAMSPGAYSDSYPVPYQENAMDSQAPQNQFAPPMPMGQSFSDKFNEAINEKVMPGFYQLTEQFDFRFILMGFVGAYVVMITLMAMVPMKQITADSISVESRRRAVTVARSLAHGNEKVLRNGDMNNFSVDYAIREEGVDDVYVVSKEGRIIAPPDRSGNTPKEMGFFRSIALKAGAHESSAEIGGGRVAAAVPILGYDAETNQNVAKAYGIVIYNQGTLQFDDGRVFSLFIQMLSLALVAGALLFFLLYKLIEYPYLQLNRELDSALRENRDNAHVKVQLPVLQNMLTNLNSLLVRAANPAHSQSSGDLGQGSKHSEYLNVLQLIGFPALLVSADGTILRANAAFPATTGISLVNIENQKITAIPDQAMHKNFSDLMARSAGMTSQLVKDSLEINGTKFMTSCQATTTAKGDVDCYFITISPMENVEGQAA